MQIGKFDSLLFYKNDEGKQLDSITMKHIFYFRMSVKKT